MSIDDILYEVGLGQFVEQDYLMILVAILVAVLILTLVCVSAAVMSFRAARVAQRARAGIQSDIAAFQANQDATMEPRPGARPGQGQGQGHGQRPGQRPGQGQGAPKAAALHLVTQSPCPPTGPPVRHSGAELAMPGGGGIVDHGDDPMTPASIAGATGGTGLHSNVANTGPAHHAARRFPWWRN